MWDSIPELQPEPKADAQLLSHPGTPHKCFSDSNLGILLFKRFIYLRECERENTHENKWEGQRKKERKSQTPHWAEPNEGLGAMTLRS